MKIRGRACGAIAVVGVLALGATALAVAPAKSHTFKGTASGRVTFATTFTAKDALHFMTSRNGEELTSFTYTDTVCALASTEVMKVGSIKVVSNGKFSIAKHKAPALSDKLKDGGKVVTTTTITGKFVSARKATGTLDYTQAETLNGKPTSHCGPITLSFTASTP
jgi:hypothetical protein